MFKIKEIFAGLKNKSYVISCCISFTVISLIYVIFSKLNIFTEINGDILLQLFAMTVLAVILMAITDKYPYKTNLGIIFMNILDISVSIFIINLLFKTFEFKPIYFFTDLIMILVSYFTVFGIFVLKDYKDAYLINKKIEKNKLQTGKETEHE